MQFDQSTRRELITLLGAAAVAWPLAARAQQPGKLPHIGVLVSASPPHPFADAFWRGLHTLGYSEGQNIAVEFRYTEARSDRAEEFADEFVRLGVDVIVAHFAAATKPPWGPRERSRLSWAAWRSLANGHYRQLGSTWRKRHRSISNGCGDRR